ncbi:PrsW family intramembrane metalloprotease [Streptomyces sp. ODS28]|uniref:PrsW family intramembrane metalloprotease n=1 Tax=Streptomyces sp. ODS28 TaxID=3136688 RepID=UPI0031ECE108
MNNEGNGAHDISGTPGSPGVPPQPAPTTGPFAPQGSPDGAYGALPNPYGSPEGQGAYGFPQGQSPRPSVPPLPAYAPAPGETPHFPEMPASPSQWRYRAPAVPSWWHRHNRTVRILTVVALLTLSALTIFAMVREQTGTAGMFVGLSLSVLPVPLLVAAFRWIDGVEPAPWREHAFAFCWGAFAATLVALLVNSAGTNWLAGSAAHADVLGATVIAPVVEETAKSCAILLLFLFRRRSFDGVVAGLAVAGITATGFAFTENVLYLGTAFGEDQLLSPNALNESVTLSTFFVRIVLSPFAHPMFTSLTGIAFGIVAALPTKGRPFRAAVPLLGLLTSALLHAIWNGSASLPALTFLAVYALFVLPVLATLVWLAVWSRRNELRTVRETLPSYAAAGWFGPAEPWSLGSMRARALARNQVRRTHGPQATRTLAEYQHFATTLALLRARTNHGAPTPDFHAREQELLHHLWTRRALSAPPTVSAGVALNRPRVPAAWVPAAGWNGQR